MSSTPPEEASFVPVSDEAASPASSDEPPVLEGQPELSDKIESIIERLPPQDRREAEIVIRQAVSQYSGPVPHANEMARYQAIDPTFPERFVAMAERQAAHRQSLETTVVTSDFALKRRGQDFAMLSVVVGLLVALVFAYIGATVVAGIVAGTTVVGVAGAFITGRVLESRNDNATEPANKPESDAN